MFDEFFPRVIARLTILNKEKQNQVIIIHNKQVSRLRMLNDNIN